MTLVAATRGSCLAAAARSRRAWSSSMAPASRRVRRSVSRASRTGRVETVRFNGAAPDARDGVEAPQQRRAGRDVLVPDRRAVQARSRYPLLQGEVEPTGQDSDQAGIGQVPDEESVVARPGRRDRLPELDRSAVHQVEPVAAVRRRRGPGARQGHRRAHRGPELREQGTGRRPEVQAGSEPLPLTPGLSARVREPPAASGYALSRRPSSSAATVARPSRSTGGRAAG